MIGQCKEQLAVSITQYGAEWSGVVGRKNNADGGQDVPFNMGELQGALNRAGKTAPGKDNVTVC